MDQHGLDLQENDIREIREIRGLKKAIRVTRARRQPLIGVRERAAR